MENIGNKREDRKRWKKESEEMIEIQILCVEEGTKKLKQKY